VQEKQRVVAAVIQRQGKLLLCRRPPEKKHGGLWEFPGGKLEANESVEDAAKRELSEELTLRVHRVGRTIFSVYDDHSGYTIEFVEVVALGEVHLVEHTDYLWAGLQELLALPLAPSDRQFAEFLVSGAG
jgi:8-oxo-dGTP diphosphatase